VITFPVFTPVASYTSQVTEADVIVKLATCWLQV